MFITSGCAPYVGYFFGLGERIAFTETTADCFSYSDRSTKTYELKQFFPPEMPYKATTTFKKSLKWLKNCYVPVVQGRHIIFIQRTASTHDLKRSCAEIRRDVAHAINGKDVRDLQLNDLRKDSDLLELLVTLLDEFCRNLELQRFDIALTCLEKSLTVTNNALIVKRLLADYLFFLKKPEACNHYLALYKLSKDRIDLEKAILSNPHDPVITERLEKSTISSDVKTSLSVAGFLASNGENEQFFANQPIDPLMLSARIQISHKDAKKSLKAQLEQLQRANATLAQEPSPLPKRGTPILRARSAFKVAASRLSDSISSISEKRASVTAAPVENDPQKDLKELYSFEAAYQRDKSYEAGMQLAEAYAKNGKVHESVQLFFTLAKNSLDNHERLEACLERIGNPTCFSESDLKLLYLFGCIIHKPNSELLKRRKPVFLELSTSGHNGEGAFFICDHPQYVACWITPEQKILFTKERAEVYSFVEGETRLMPFSLPEEVPDEIRFLSADAVPWLLGKGYAPNVLSDQVTFTLTGNSRSSATCLAKASLALQKLRDDNLADFIQHVKEENYGLAHASLQKVKNQNEICDLFAEFLAFLKRPEAIKRFLMLSRSQDTFYYLQRALAVATTTKAPETYSIYMKLYDLLCESHFLNDHAAWLCLHGFLYFTCRQPNDEYAATCMLKVPEPFHSLARVATLGRPKEFTMTSCEEAFSKYLAIRQALIDMSRETETCHDLQEYFSSDAFNDKRNAMSVVILEIRNIARTDRNDELDSLLKKMNVIAQFLEEMDIALANSDPESVRNILYAARDSLLPPEVVARKNSYLGLERVQGLSSYYRVKNECDDDKGADYFWNLFHRMTSDRPKMNLEGIFTSLAFAEKVESLNRVIRKVDLSELKNALIQLEEYIQAKAFSDAERILRTIYAMKLPDTIKEKIDELYEFYISFPLIPTAKEQLCRQRMDVERPTIQTVLQKATKLTSETFTQHLEEGNIKKAELCLVREKSKCVDDTTRKKLDDLHLHLLFALQRDEAIDFCFALIKEKEGILEGSHMGHQRAGLTNKLCAGVRSDTLYYLERLLMLCIDIHSPRLAEVYDMIIDVCTKKNVPTKVVSTIALHALFQLLDTDLAAAKRFYKKVDADDPLLYPCARLAMLDRKAKSLRQREYKQLTQLFEDAKRVSAYLGEHALCSLEYDVHKECLKILEFEEMYEAKKLGLLLIDTLMAKGHYMRAQEMVEAVSSRLNAFNIGSAVRYSYLCPERLQAGRFSCLKREAAIGMALGDAPKAAQALQRLYELYQKSNKREKALLCTKLLYKHSKNQHAFRRLVEALPPKELVSHAVDNAFRSFVLRYFDEVQESIDVARETGLLTEEETFLLQLIETLTNVQETQRKLGMLEIA